MMKILMGFGLSALGLYVAFKNLDLEQLAQSLTRIRVDWVLAAAFFTIFSVWIRGMRWRIILAPICDAATHHLFLATMIGYFGNGVLPMRAGEVIKAFVVSRLYPAAPLVGVLGTVVVERLLDMIGLALVCGLIMVSFETPPWFAWGTGGVIAVVVCGVAFLVAVSCLSASRIERIGEAVTGRWGWAARPWALLRSFVDGVSTLHHSGKPGLIAIQTGVYWIFQWALMLTVAWAMDIPLGWMQAGTLLVGTMLAASLPSAPANIGLYHAAAVVTMTAILGYPEPVAQAYAILSHAVRVLLPTFLGGAVALVMSPSLPGLRAKSS
jgi:uncharacterized protein (TIRG00374 family)